MISTVNCPACRRPNHPTNQACFNCGTPLQATQPSARPWPPTETFPAPLASPNYYVPPSTRTYATPPEYQDGQVAYARPPMTIPPVMIQIVVSVLLIIVGVVIMTQFWWYNGVIYYLGLSLIILGVLVLIVILLRTLPQMSMAPHPYGYAQSGVSLRCRNCGTVYNENLGSCPTCGAT